MSKADGLADNTNPLVAATQTGSTSPATSDPDATLDSSAAAAFAAAERTVVREPISIGPYRLVRKLGEGGMGQVWLAEQTAPVQRQVALKLIKVGRYDDSVLQRFYAERQSLAIMEHPSIAKVFDAGATPDGQPYFVMEYVPGLPISDYCDQKRFKIRERLELFVKVCEGVQHAHQKAIMHRDLKPANILVVEVDGKPVPRIIDFGLAKAVSRPVDGETLFTQMGGWVGTPGYMSPEQADPNVMDVDTRTDVYSLGAVLYILLTGSLPFEAKDRRKQRVEDLLRQLREEDPPRPSTKIGGQNEFSKATAAIRGTEPKELASLLHGDLDWITMKALEKDRARRYGTPMELAVDIGRYLANEPIVARPASPTYRLRKYVRRHRVSVTVVTGIVLLLAGFAGMQAVQIRRVTRERDRANRLTDFMLHIFKVSDPSESRGNSITARELLDKASMDIDTGLAGDPALQALMLHTMGEVYDSLGLSSRAEALFARAVEIRARTLGQENPDTLESRSFLDREASQQGRYAEAEKMQRETLDIERRVLRPNDPKIADSMNQLAWILRKEGHYSESEKLYREAFDMRRRVLGPDSRETLGTASNLANLLTEEGSYVEAEKLGSETLGIQQKALGAEHPDTLSSMSALAGILDDEARYPESEKLYRQTVEMMRRVLGPEHRVTLSTTSDLAVVLEEEDRYSEAEKTQRATLESQQRVLGAESPFALNTMGDLARTLQHEQHYAEAEKLCRQTLEIRRRVLGPEARGTLGAMNSLAVTLAMEKHYGEAEKLYRETLDTRRRILGPDNPETASSYLNLGYLEAREGNKEQALSFITQAVDHGLSPSGDLGLETDSVLAFLHGDPRFTALVAHAKEKAAVARKEN